MKNFRIYFPVIFFVFSFLVAHSQELTLNFTDLKRSFTIQSEKILIKSELVSPSTQPAIPAGEWKHIISSTAQTKLADLFGSSTSDLFRNGDIELEREIWLSGDKTVIATRQKLVNKGVHTIHLDTLVILASLSEDGISLNENPVPDNWNILVQKRFKNDVPECIVPKGDFSVKADPFLIIPVGSDNNGASLLIGYLNQIDHLAHLNLSFKNKSGKTVLKGLYGKAEFNGVTIPPNGEKTSQWIYITVGQTFEKTINEYTDRVGKYHNVKSPSKNAPTIFEFFSQQIKGVFKKQNLVELGELDPHVATLVKIIPWDGKNPVLAGTDLHFSMGGVEISEWKADRYSVKGTLNTDWLVPVKVTAVFPTSSSDLFETRTITIQPNQKKFWIDWN